MLVADSASNSELARIEKVLSSGQPFLPKDFESLKSILAKFPHTTRVIESYKSALIKREDWAALADFLIAQPPGKLSRTDRANLARAALRLGRYDDVITTAKPLVDEDPNDVDTASILASGYYNIGRMDESAAIFDRHWSAIVDQKRISEITLRGLIHHRQGNDEKAIEVLLKSAELSPDNITALNTLSRIYNAHGDLARAEEFRRRNEAAQAKQAAEAARAHHQVQMLYELQDKWEQQKFTDVIIIARKAIESATESNKPVLYQYIAESYSKLGRPQDARAALMEIERLKQKQ
ncbi:tetratricopeptide repeat protein [Leptolyngbya sp. 7M]|uniref:tetratricopeptide repeat protein n=1 Tax=Leptolyngbya sp. 7M TaxID=2812896 RepID=UPI001B8BBDEA|nr:tetratricopeptide repeat protein [Leptolyngbya sp. 7M]QYO67076.1 tetratricopeptide repeat protein [Leptolyngbya sp. 7M]